VSAPGALEFLRHAVEIRDPLSSAFALQSRPMAALRMAPEFSAIVAGLRASPETVRGSHAPSE
jgi:hypothetical protein